MNEVEENRGLFLEVLGRQHQYSKRPENASRARPGFAACDLTILRKKLGWERPFTHTWLSEKQLNVELHISRFFNMS
jgi:hypothetical protein